MLTVDPAGEYLLLGALNSPMRLVSTEQGQVVRQYRGHSNKLYCCISTFITTLPQQALACGSDDGSIFVWDVDSKQVRMTGVLHVYGSRSSCSRAWLHCDDAFGGWRFAGDPNSLMCNANEYIASAVIREACGCCSKSLRSIPDDAR